VVTPVFGIRVHRVQERVGWQVNLRHGGGYLSAVSVFTRSLAALFTEFYFGVAGLFIYVVSLSSSRMLCMLEDYSAIMGGLGETAWLSWRLVSHRLSGEPRVD
jgi:hypothetical protein